MSWKATNAVTEHSKHSGSEYLCLLMLANRADENGENIRPSVPTLARDCRMSERGVRYVLARLLESGEIIQTGTHYRGVKIYRLVLPPWGTPQPLNNVQGSPMQTVQGSPLQDGTPPLQNDASTPATAIAHKRYERSIERSLSDLEIIKVALEDGSELLIERWKVNECFIRNGKVFFGDGSPWTNAPELVRNEAPHRP